MYAAAGQKDDPEKHAIAGHLIRESEFLLSAQVLGEFYHRVRYLQHELLTVAKAQEWMNRLVEFCAVDVDAALISSAMFVRERFKIQFWDAALIAASQRLALPILYTEDLSHRQKYGSVTVINPFKA